MRSLRVVARGAQAGGKTPRGGERVESGGSIELGGINMFGTNVKGQDDEGREVEGERRHDWEG